MTLESKIRGLCQQIAASDDDGQCVQLAADLREALHECVESMRGKVIVFPMSDPVLDVEDAS